MARLHCLSWAGGALDTMRSALRRGAGLCGLVVAVLGCAGHGTTEAPDGTVGTEITNPSGSCGTRTDGGRALYHAPGPGEVWVPDCQLGLSREYWRLFTADGDTGYIQPHPSHPALEAACDDSQHELNAMLVRYALCTPPATQEQLDMINHIELQDALVITRFLHSELEFEASGTRISPGPMASDIVDACRLGTNSAELELICARERNRLATGSDDVPFSYEGPGAVELAARLNQLYGIP